MKSKLTKLRKGVTMKNENSQKDLELSNNNTESSRRSFFKKTASIGAVAAATALTANEATSADDPLIMHHVK